MTSPIEPLWLFAVTNVLALVVLVGLAAAWLRKADRDHRRTNAALKASLEELADLRADFAARTRMEEESRAREEHLQLAARVGGVGTFEHDHVTGHVYVSSLLREMAALGEEVPNPLGAFFDAVIAEDKPGFVLDLERSFDPVGDGQFRYTHRVRHHDDSIRWLRAQAQTWFEGDGDARRPMRTIGAVTDISEQMRTDSATRESEERFRLITEAIDDVFWISDVGGSRIIYVSPAYERIFGRPAAALMRDPGALVESIYEDDRERIENDLQVQRQGLPFEHEYRIIRPDGSMRWICSRGYPVENPSGPVTRYVGVAEDITDRKHAAAATRESEERFRQVVENIHEVFWMTDIAKNRMLYVSPGYEEIWGRTCESLYESPRTWQEAIHPDDRDRVMAAAESRQIEGTYDETYRIVRSDGSLRWIRDRAFPIRNASGVVHRVVGVAENVTERKLAEEHQLRYRKLQALGTLAGGIAHDFNNILVAISGNAKMAIGDLPPQHSAHESLVEIDKAARRAKDLVERILAFSRPSDPKRESLELPPVFEEALRLVRSTIAATIQFRTRFDPATPPVHADAAQMHQVIVNLMTNAGHAIGKRTGSIDVTLEPVTVDADSSSPAPGELRPGRYALLTVRDDGCGMSAETRARIFDPFFTTKPVDVGTGLGLSVVHGIVQSHHGAILVQSEADRGSTFCLYFPAAGHEQAPEDAAATPPRATRGGCILYVDDEEPLVFLAERMLTRLGYTVVGCTSPHDGLARFRETPAEFDIVVTDLAMPGMTGFEFARAILAVRGDVPVVMTSGYVEAADHAEAMRIGVRALITKPNTVDDLCAVIDDIAEKTATAAFTADIPRAGASV